MRILQLLAGYDSAGLFGSIVPLIKELRKRGHEVEEEFIPLLTKSMDDVRDSAEVLASVVPRFRWADVVHVHTPTVHRLLALSGIVPDDVGLVSSRHATGIPTDKEWRAAAKRTDVFVPVARFLMQEFFDSGVPAGKIIPVHNGVYVSETRPLLQGARLTAWELARDGIPATLIADGAAGFLMRRRDAIACVIVGADRIAANGDVANKIGTYTLAVLASEHSIPFYVAAPTSTIDLTTATGDQIPIEERSAEELTAFADVTVAPAGTDALNPAFDVTPHRYVSAIISERGIVRDPYAKSLPQLFQQEGVRHA